MYLPGTQSLTPSYQPCLAWLAVCFLCVFCPTWNTVDNDLISYLLVLHFLPYLDIYPCSIISLLYDFHYLLCTCWTLHGLNESYVQSWCRGWSLGHASIPGREVLGSWRSGQSSKVIIVKDVGKVSSPFLESFFSVKAFLCTFTC